MRLDVRRAADRFVTDAGWVASRHSFSYGSHYDSANISFGPLLAHNDDVLAPSGRFDEHPHHDLEIVTWVIDGSLAHEDSAGRRGVLTAGQAQRLWTGDGVRHSEGNASPGRTRYVQMWLAAEPGQGGPGSEYGVCDVNGALAAGGFVTVAAGPPADPAGARAPSGPPAAVRGALSLRLAGAVLHVARAAPGARLTLPGAPAEIPPGRPPGKYLTHVYVATGAVDVAGVRLTEGDALRLTDGASPAEHSFEGPLTIAVVGEGSGGAADGGRPGEVLVWQFTT